MSNVQQLRDESTQLKKDLESLKEEMRKCQDELAQEEKRVQKAREKLAAGPTGGGEAPPEVYAKIKDEMTKAYLAMRDKRRKEAAAFWKKQEAQLNEARKALVEEKKAIYQQRKQLQQLKCQLRDNGVEAFADYEPSPLGSPSDI